MFGLYCSWSLFCAGHQWIIGPTSLCFQPKANIFSKNGTKLHTVYIGVRSGEHLCSTGHCCFLCATSELTKSGAICVLPKVKQAKPAIDQIPPKTYPHLALKLKKQQVILLLFP